MSDGRKVHGGRALINLPGHHSTAGIVAEIEDTEEWPKGKGRGGAELNRYNSEPEAMLLITDCDNKVTLELDVNTDNNLRNSLYKVDTIIDCLCKVRSGLIVERERYKARAKLIPADKKWGANG